MSEKAKIPQIIADEITKLRNVGLDDYSITNHHKIKDYISRHPNNYKKIMRALLDGYEGETKSSIYIKTALDIVRTQARDGKSILRYNIKILGLNRIMINVTNDHPDFEKLHREVQYYSKY